MTLDNESIDAETAAEALLSNHDADLCVIVIATRGDPICRVHVVTSEEGKDADVPHFLHAAARIVEAATTVKPS
jgi:hypothetical protein